MPLLWDVMVKLLGNDEKVKNDEKWKKIGRKKSKKNEIKTQEKKERWRSNRKINPKEIRWFIWRSWDEFQVERGREEK